MLDDRQYLLETRISLLETRIETLKKQHGSTKPGARKDFLASRIASAKSELSGLLGKEFDTPLKGAHFIFNAIALTSNIAPEKLALAGLNKYNNSIKDLVTKCESKLICSKPPKGAPTFIGAQNCKACHLQAYETWKKAVFTMPGKDKLGKNITRKVGHSKAWSNLIDAHKESDRSCVGCHSAGFMIPGGYCKVSEVASLKNVSCESCHGPGSEHAKTGDKRLIRRSVPEALCRKCHMVPHIPSSKSFVYQEKLKKILGPGHQLKAPPIK